MKAYIKYFYLGLIVFLPSHRIVAQENTAFDSISNISYSTHSVYMRSYQMATKNSVWMSKEVKNNFNQILIAGNYNTGDFIALQDATKLRKLQVQTEGKTEWRGTQLWGKFAYSKQMEDSTRLRHQTRWNEDAPVYYGSLKNNYYERDIYKLDAGIQHNFFNNRVPVTLDLDYRVGNNFSNNDPRGDVKDHNFNTALSVGYQTEKWIYHLRGLYGYGRERVNVAFKNSKYTENTADPLYVNWFMNGYGNAIERIKEINYNNDLKRHGISVHVRHQLNKEQRLYVNLATIQEEQFFKQYNISVLTYIPMNKYKRDSYTASALWILEKDLNHQTAVGLEGGIIDGRDFNYDLMKNNYLYRQEYVKADVTQVWRNYQFNGIIGYQSEDKKEGLTGNHISISTMTAGLGAKRTFSLTKLTDLIGSLRIRHKLPITQELLLPVTNSGVFAKTLIYHDYLYNASSSTEVGTSWGVNINKIKRTAWRFSFDIDYEMRNKLPSYSFDPLSVPGNNRTRLGAQIAYLF